MVSKVTRPPARRIGVQLSASIVVALASSLAFAQTGTPDKEQKPEEPSPAQEARGEQAGPQPEVNPEMESGAEANEQAAAARPETEREADEVSTDGAEEETPVGTFEDVEDLPEGSEPKNPTEGIPSPAAEAEPTPPPTGLVARPSPEPKVPSRPLYVAPRKEVLTAERPGVPNVDRRESVPGDTVARPLTLPEGTFVFSFHQGFVLADDAGSRGNSPAFALGITPELEFGISAPLRFDQGSSAWSVLEPLPHIGVTWEETDRFGVGTRVGVLIPTSAQIDPQVQLEIPVLLRPNESWRVDFALLSEVGFESSTEVSLGALAGASVQVAPWFFTGAEVALDLGVTGGRTTGVDGALLAGLTYQSRGHANVDLVARVFAENMGGGRQGQFSDGTGFSLSVSFFPELY